MFRWCSSLLVPGSYSDKTGGYQTNSTTWCKTPNPRGVKVKTKGIEGLSHTQSQEKKIPFVIMGNVQSLSNKMDVLATLTKTQREWLHGHVQYKKCELPNSMAGQRRWEEQ